MFLFLGILFHGTPRKYLIAVQEAIKGAGGIIIQFPFYAGIVGVMTASGLATVISEAFVVPSGGGQWAVQAPIMLETADMLSSVTAKVAMAVPWGDRRLDEHDLAVLDLAGTGNRRLQSQRHHGLFPHRVVRQRCCDRAWSLVIENDDFGFPCVGARYFCSN